MEKQIKDLRLELDAASKSVGQLVEPQHKGLCKELEKAEECLIFSKAWLGKCLEELGTPNPYKQDAKTKEEITPTQDVADIKEAPVQDLTHLDKVNGLRNEIGAISDKLKKIAPEKSTREFSIARTNSYNYCCEAKFWLGFELARIKNN